jgi:putative sigma-54 modulation protein
MQITVTGRHFEITDALRQHIESKLHKLDRHLERVSEIHVILSVEKHRHSAEITFQANGVPIRSLEETHDMYLSVDTAIEKVEKQLKRYKKRGTERKSRVVNKEATVLPVGEELADREGEQTPVNPQPKVIRSKRFAVKPMSVDEAAMQMGLTTDEFLAFVNSETEQMNVMYRRRDGNYGLIEPEF